MQRLSTLIFLIGLGVILAALYQQLGPNAAVTNVGQAINAVSADALGAGNLVTSVVLGYRGFDTLLELTILFTVATVVGLVLDGGIGQPSARPAGFILRAGADLAFPLLLVVGMYIVFHGHLTPGGGFQGGVILATAFFVPLLARPESPFNHRVASIIEGLAGAAFIVIGLLALLDGKEFLAPLLGKGELGQLFSAGSLPLLYIAVGLKVGAELAGLLASLATSQGTGEFADTSADQNREVIH